MEAGGLLEVRPGFSGVVGEGFTFLTHILSYRHGPTDLFSIGASSSATRFYVPFLEESPKPSKKTGVSATAFARAPLLVRSRNGFFAQQENGCANAQRLSR
jgi:hypothetical protein